ncbi:hypothetical protein [Brucella pseudogrignonensis]|uniref:Uncharacterized protein n=1 Tax=Brucella pseudogrignonensis TaxID=419475 RepID=A0ABU1M7M3_9HYPH|nr:hypothetical protein [Brucella pseudogrignonensis]MDR6432014.1 hypothetical protein [Brucella pseudogrignonensis]
MASCDLKLSLNGDSLSVMLSMLTEVANRFPEFGSRLLSLLNSGDELFIIDNDNGATTVTGELVVSFKPSDSLFGLVATFSASNPDILI